MFPVILTDRGTEFYFPEAIECDRFGEIKTRLFYYGRKGCLKRTMNISGI